jgi:hypothetical protein
VSPLLRWALGLFTTGTLTWIIGHFVLSVILLTLGVFLLLVNFTRELSE